MSKRAKELADDFREWMVARNAWPMAGDTEVTGRLVAMVDAELRKERERCADRADNWLDSETKDSGMEDNPAFARLRERQHFKLRAAILEADE